jgi:proteasome-associated ATPase
MLLTIDRFRTQLRKAGEVHQQLEEVYKNLEEAYSDLSTPPLYPATFVERREIGDTQTALVHYNNSFRFVNLSEEFECNGVDTGDQVLLSGDLNLLVGHVPGAPLNCGETAMFDRFTDDGRLVLSHREGIYVANASGALRNVSLKNGDEVRWSPSSWIAYEKIERSNGDHLFLEEAPHETFDDIGGLDTQIETLKNLVLLHLQHGDLARQYGLPPQRAALMEGPPGTGKTLLAKALVNFLKGLSPSGRARFLNVKFSDLGSMWYSETERNIDKFFRTARDAAAAEPEIPVVLFFDEFDAIAAARGGNIHRVDDRVVDALAIALDGLQARGNLLVLAATNRKDILDPALIRPGRFGSTPINVGRPNRTAARAILSKHLRDDMPYATGNGSGAASREEILDTALSRLYSPNGDGDVATITFRDGKRQPIRVHELLSGAVLAKLVHAASQRSLLREIQTGERGIQLTDMLAAIADEVMTIARVLTPANCRRYLDDLPQDVDVVSVDPVKRKPTHSHRFAQVS